MKFKELIKEIAKNALKMVDKAGKEVGFVSIEEDLDGFMNHVIFVHADEIEESQMFRFGNVTYFVLFTRNNKGVMFPFAIIILDDDALSKEDFEVSALLMAEEASTRAVNKIELIDPTNTFEGFFIMPDGGIFIRYSYRRNGINEIKNDRLEGGFSDISININ